MRIKYYDIMVRYEGHKRRKCETTYSNRLWTFDEIMKMIKDLNKTTKDNTHYSIRIRE